MVLNLGINNSSSKAMLFLRSKIKQEMHVIWNFLNIDKSYSFESKYLIHFNPNRTVAQCARNTLFWKKIQINRTIGDILLKSLLVLETFFNKIIKVLRNLENKKQHTFFKYYKTFFLEKKFTGYYETL